MWDEFIPQYTVTSLNPITFANNDCLQMRMFSAIIVEACSPHPFEVANCRANVSSFIDHLGMCMYLCLI